MNGSNFNAMVEALQAAGLTSDADTTEYGWSEHQAWEPVTEIDFADWVDMVRATSCSDNEYFEQLAEAFEERHDKFLERSERSKTAIKRKKLDKHLNAKAAQGLTAPKSISLF